ncbi:SusC/RagA family TonB-linked outer membrane protein [Robertkochia solimangrovi]|uniref:SusC/RagA family TonB-linked outer membrane protein n=1 Tax=Robertkochia solimangrovi TaxID=2213046 RepID=UPI0011800AE3|nr:TonB-dependent receptor [Robertkochia solimangrovi]TRZ41280.1 SusC/RagA family TonB-linked outer membrane protein [Robertkochia solimangrovi]
MKNNLRLHKVLPENFIEIGFSLRSGIGRSGIPFLFLMFMLSLGSINIYAQNQKTITGIVKDNTGLAIPSVSVMEKGTSNGVQTDFDGNYSITVPTDAVLVFSYLGMKTVEVQVGADSVIDVTLETDQQQLDEVVLVGYGTQKKISVVGAQSTIEPAELQQPVSNLTTTLAGRVAGLTGVQRSGLPGYDGADIWIRGISNISGDNSPLILVDGVQRSMNNIDPRDIKSFTVLKDASATAIYGIRGANGVILIETKRGIVGKPEVSIDYNEGVTQFTRMPDLADGVLYMQLANEALTTRGQVPRYSQQTIDRTASNYDPLLYPNVDWFDTVFNDFGRNRSASANVSGGAEKATYYVSLSYYDETGLFVTDGLENYESDTKYKRYNFTSNLSLDITETTHMHLGVQGYVSEGNYPSESVDNIFSQAMLVPPVEYPVLYPGGYVPGISSNGDLRNPYADVAMRGYRNENKNQVYSNLRLTQDLDFFTEGLSLTAMFAFDAYNEHFITRSKRESTYFVNQDYPYTEDGEIILNETFAGSNYLGFDPDNGGNRRFYLETSLNYDRSFGDHTVTGLLLFNRSDFIDAFAEDFTGSIPYRNQGFAGRVTYSYDNRYFAEVNAGYNGSENFSPDNRYGFFPSWAVGWVVSNESFFEPLSNVVDYLKIRYSDGLVGSASGAGRFAYLSRVEDGQDGYNFGENVYGVGGIAETYEGVDVTWAESRKQDLGLELNMFDNSFRLIFDLFKERTEGAFLQRSDVPAYIGLVSDPFGNLGVTENKGFDGTLEYNKYFNEDFSLKFRGTFSYNKNKVIENGVPEQPYEWLNRQGSGLLARWGYVAERLYTLEDDTDGDGFITPSDGDGIPEQFGQIMPGDIKYTDLNGDGRIDAYDQRQIGDGDVPYFTYGLGISAQLKGFDVSLFFQGQSAADIMMSGIGIQPFIGDGGRGNLYTVAQDRWTPENNDPYAMYPRLSYGSSGIGQTNNTQQSTWWLRDINFLRLKTAEIGYTLPESVTQKMRLDNVRFYLRGTNLFTISDFDLWDPELLTSNGGQYPNISVGSLGVSFRF